jgi:hypothetical protein
MFLDARFSGGENAFDVGEHVAPKVSFKTQL